MSTQLLLDGLKAMILGMGMVYVFLIIMIWIMNLTSKFLKPYAGFLEPKPAGAKANRKVSASAEGPAENEMIEAAAAAVRLYRRDNKTGQSASIGVPVNGKILSVQVTPSGAEAPSAKKQETPAPAASAVKTNVEIKSPLPGTIVKVEVKPGDRIAAGDVLAVIEAMKMETEIRAESAGTICEVLVSPKDIVASEQTILLMETEK